MQLPLRPFRCRQQPSQLTSLLRPQPWPAHQTPNLSLHLIVACPKICSFTFSIFFQLPIDQLRLAKFSVRARARAAPAAEFAAAFALASSASKPHGQKPPSPPRYRQHQHQSVKLMRHRQRHHFKLRRQLHLNAILNDSLNDDNSSYEEVIK